MKPDDNRGRKVKHTNPLPEIQAIAAIRTLHKVMKKNGWSEAQTIKEYDKLASAPEILKLDEKELNYAQFYFDSGTFKKASSVDRKTNKSLNDNNKWGIYLWMREFYPDELKSSMADEIFQQKEGDVYAFHSLCGHKNLNTDMASTLGGNYNLYRPSHFDPNNGVLVQRLIVGGDKETDIFDCALTAEYEKRPGVLIQDCFTGKIVPQENRAAAVLKAPHGFIIIHFDDIDPNYVKKETISMSGLMITALGNGRSSAWPVYAERVDADEPIEKPILSRADLTALPERVIEALDRGAVHWDAKHYPRSLAGLQQG